jgi:ferritin-like metal-binding protein YciE
MAAKRKSSGRSKKESPDGVGLLAMELQEIHSAENQLSRVLPRLTKVVESNTLRQMLEQRLAQGEKILEDVDSALEELEMSPGRKKNVAAEGLVSDMREHIQEIEAGPALDAVVIGSIQKTEHYCIAAWGTAKALAEATGQSTVVRAMERALKEGKQVDEELTQLAEKEINPAVVAQGTEEQEEGETGSSGGKSSRSEQRSRAAH